MATLSSACFMRQQPGRPLKTLNVTNTILRSEDIISPTSYRPQCTAKRKSAVELLQETKSLYVKSETVLDRKQELRRSLRSSGSSDKGSSSHDIASSCYHYKGNCCNWSSGSFTCLPPPKSPRLVAGCQRKSTADSQQLQNDLRRLLNTDSKENLFEATSVFLDGLDDVIVPPPVQYRRSVSHGQHQFQNEHEDQSSACHKSLPDLTDIVETTTATVTAVVANPVHCGYRDSTSPESVAGDDEDDGDDDIFDACCDIPSPRGFGNKLSKLDETEATTTTNVSSFPDSLSLTSYKTDARWQQSAHGETGSSIEEENDGCGNVSPRPSGSPVKSTASHGQRRPRAVTTACSVERIVLPPPPLPPKVAVRRRQIHGTMATTSATAAETDEFRSRPILRSKSDVGNRAPNLLSLLPATTAASAAMTDDRLEYSPEQLENFFGHLGLDPEEYESIMKNVLDSDGSSVVCFSDSNSSVGSVSGGSNGNNNNNNHNNNSHGHCGSGGADGCGGAAMCASKSGGGSSTASEHPSIVERNARIIKWLWNCRRANLQQTPQAPSST